MVNVYVDGAGGEKSGYGYFIKDTGESFYEEKLGITNNQAEYFAIISALKKFQNSSRLIKQMNKDVILAKKGLKGKLVI